MVPGTMVYCVPCVVCGTKHGGPTCSADPQSRELCVNIYETIHLWAKLGIRVRAVLEKVSAVRISPLMLTV